MTQDALVFAFFIIFAGAAVMGTLALYARQALIVAYILLGVIAGPGVTGIVSEVSLIQDIAHVGIMFLLFLLGIDLRPVDLISTLRQTTVVTVISSILFAGLGTVIGLAAGFGWHEAFLIGGCLMFSSTILGLKLLPTTALHHQRMGRMIVGVLLLQDLIAIGLLLFVETTGTNQAAYTDVLRVLAGVPVLALVAFVFGRYILQRLLLRFDTIREYIFLVTVGWCLGMAELGAVFGFSHEIGAFIAGVTLATSPISEYIADTLRPVRDFFLVMFFFALGAAFQLGILQQVWLWALLLTTASLLLKPLVFTGLFRLVGEAPQTSGEMGVRLGQISEFSLLVAVIALDTGFISERASYLIQTATIGGFMLSSSWIVMRYPTPIAVSDRLRRD